MQVSLFIVTLFAVLFGIAVARPLPISRIERRDDTCPNGVFGCLQTIIGQGLVCEGTKIENTNDALKNPQCVGDFFSQGNVPSSCSGCLDPIKNAAKAVVGAFDAAGDAIGKAVVGTAGTVLGVAEAAGEAVEDGAEKVGEKIKDKAEDVKTGFGKLKDGVKGFFSSIF